MALYKRKRSTRRRGASKRMRIAKSAPRMSRSVVARPNQPHAFVRYTPSLVVNGNVAYAPYAGAQGITLANVVNSGEFANLYDQYCIDKLELSFWLRIDPSAQSASAASYPRLFWYRDYDDLNFPTLSECRENSKCKIAVLHPDRPVRIYVKPNVLQLIYQSAITNQFKPAFGQWLDCTLLNTTHYGIKYCIDDLTNTNYKVEIELKVHFRCRNPR